jgi:hypothetical protein
MEACHRFCRFYRREVRQPPPRTVIGSLIATAVVLALLLFSRANCQKTGSTQKSAAEMMFSTTLQSYVSWERDAGVVAAAAKGVCGSNSSLVRSNRARVGFL